MDKNDYQPGIITNNVKVLMTFIDRVGFPILAFLLMFWSNMQFGKTIAKLTDLVAVNVEVLRDIKAQLQARN